MVGVVADTIPFRGASEVPSIVYLLHRQQATYQRDSFADRRTVMSFILRTSGDPLALAEMVRAKVGEVDQNTPVASIRTRASARLAAVQMPTTPAPMIAMFLWSVILSFRLRSEHGQFRPHLQRITHHFDNVIDVNVILSVE